MIAAAAVVLIALLAVGIYLLSRPNDLLVPTVNDFSEERAVNVLEAAGFEVEVDRVTRDDVPKGEVFDQEPDAGETIETQSDLARFFEGTEPPVITITVSTGPGDVEVPAVVGESVETAVQRLEQAGLEVERVERFSPNVREDRVIDAEPPAGTTVRGGSTVTIFVSKGPRLIPIPDVTGLEEDAARDELTEAGFFVDVDREESDEEEGVVISQDTGSEPKGTAVTIVVSQGPGEITMPSLAGETRDEAVDELRGAGFTGNIEIVEQETDDPDEDDVVVQQFPSPGSDLDPSTPVQITVGVFVEPEEPTETTTTTTPTTTPEEP
jgi:serine/threonine-protein kinase